MYENIGARDFLRVRRKHIAEPLPDSMKRPRSTRIPVQNVKLVAVSVLVTICGLVTAYFTTFSNQNATAYDDEGTLMIIIKRFLDGQALYDQIGVPYGPLYYFFEWCAHVLTGASVSHDSVQFVSVFFWVICALLVFLFVYRATSSILLAAAAHFLSFHALVLVGIEPAHPQELCITLLAALGLAACSVSSRIVLMISLGALAAAMAATKINLGVFAVIALALALLAAFRRGWPRSVLLTAAGAAALLFPVALMWSHRADWWAEKYCFVTIISLGAALLVVSREEFQFSTEAGDFLFAGSGFAATIVAVGWFAAAHGSSVHGMIDSLIIQPQNSFSKSWFLEAHFPNFALPWSLMGITCAGLAATKRVSERAVALLKVAFAVGIGFLSLAGLYDAVMSFGPPFIWLVAVRPGQTLPDHIGSLPRAILALVAVTQIWYAYPVAGLQVPFVAVMMIALAAICLADGMPFVYACFPRLTAPALSNIGMLPVTALVVLYVFSTGAAIQYYREAEPLGLPGTGLMRIGHERAALTRNLAGRIDSSPCTMLASAPGLFSFNFLTGRPAPRDVNLGAWMLLVSDADQQKAIKELSGERYPCVLYNQSIIDFWTHGADVSSRPLMKFMKENFEVVFETSGYRFMEPKRPAP